MLENNSNDISNKPQINFQSKVSVSIKQIGKLISEKDKQKAFDFLREIIEPYARTCNRCGDLFYSDKSNEVYCDTCKQKSVYQRVYEQKNIEKTKEYKRNWARKHRVKKETTND